VKMSYTTVVLNNGKPDRNGQLPVIRLSQRDEQLEEMVRIWTTLSPSQKVALLQEATRASSLNQAIEAFRETPMEALKAKLVQESGRNANAQQGCDFWFRKNNPLK
jgi:hypothetical protein